MSDLFEHHDETCPDCGYEKATLNHDTGQYKLWVECPNCGHGILSYDEMFALADRGYDEPELRAAALDGIAGHPTPYNNQGDMYEKLNWWEFCRALKEEDFTPGDEFGLNGIRFVVEPDDNPLEAALVGLLEYIVSGDHYEVRNPYSVPQVVAGLQALAGSTVFDKYIDVLNRYRKEA